MSLFLPFRNGKLIENPHLRAKLAKNLAEILPAQKQLASNRISSVRISGVFGIFFNQILYVLYYFQSHFILCIIFLINEVSLKSFMNFRNEVLTRSNKSELILYIYTKCLISTPRYG